MPRSIILAENVDSILTPEPETRLVILLGALIPWTRCYTMLSWTIFLRPSYIWNFVPSLPISSFRSVSQFLLIMYRSFFLQEKNSCFCSLDKKLPTSGNKVKCLLIWCTETNKMQLEFFQKVIMV
jgi:hypothetical protein